MKKKMRNNTRQIGVWLDHAEAHFFLPAVENVPVETVDSTLESQERHGGQGADGIKLGGFRSTNNEHHKHNREQDALHKYYKEIQHKLLDFDEIYLFGPGSARNELHNLMLEDEHFKTKNIHVEPSDHLTENQMKTKVTEFFSA